MIYCNALVTAKVFALLEHDHGKTRTAFTQHLHTNNGDSHSKRPSSPTTQTRGEGNDHGMETGMDGEGGGSCLQYRLFGSVLVRVTV